MGRRGHAGAGNQRERRTLEIMPIVLPPDRGAISEMKYENQPIDHRGDRLVSGDVTVPTPHRPERADFLHSVLHGRALLVAAYGWKILTDGRGWRFRISFRRVHRTTLWRSLRESHFCHILTA